jgi:hypothetical protein
MFLAAQRLGRAMVAAEAALGLDRFVAVQEELMPLADTDAAGTLTLAGIEQLADALEALTAIVNSIPHEEEENPTMYRRTRRDRDLEAALDPQDAPDVESDGPPVITDADVAAARRALAAGVPVHRDLEAAVRFADDLAGVSPTLGEELDAMVEAWKRGDLDGPAGVDHEDAS